MADELGGVIDAPADGIADIGADTSSIDTSSSQVDSNTESTEIASPESEVTAQPGRLVENGKLTASAKAAIDALRADPKNIKVADALRRDLFFAERMRSQLPGGIEELNQLKAQIEEFGGPEGAQEFRQEIDGWREFDEQFTAGDPKILDFMMETPETTAAFLKIAPMAFDRYREAHPDGWSKYVANVFTADMNRFEYAKDQFASLPLIIERLGDFIPQDNPRAQQLVQIMGNYVKRIQILAASPVSDPKIEKPAAAVENPELAAARTGELNATRENWQKAANDEIHSPLFNDAWKKLLADKQVSPEQQKAIIKYYKTELSELLGRKEHNSNLERYLKGKQKDGFMKAYRADYTEVVPRALRATIEAFGMSAKAKTTPSIPKPGAPVAKTPAATGKPVGGFAFTAQKPNIKTEVDTVQTTPDMWSSKRAVLKSGKRVQWK